MKMFIPIILVTTVLAFVVNVIHAQKIPTTQEAKKNTNTTFTAKTFKNADNTYGYDVYANSKLLIHQPNIPTMPGNKGFATKQDASIVAKLVIEKLEQNIMPPTITKEELRKLKVIPQ